MHFLGLVWFALLHALSPVSAPPAEWLNNASAHTQKQDTRSSWAIASAPFTRHALRAPARTAAAIVSQSAGVVVPDRSDAPPLERASHLVAEPRAPRGQSAVRARHQSIAPRGSVLPYFPTAPPTRA